MKPCDLIDGASYGPETLKAMTRAYDAAWREIGSSFGNDSRDIQKARLRLAQAVLSIASQESCDVAALKTGALQAMALSYRERLPT
jgi:hypothetical protein